MEPVPSGFGLTLHVTPVPGLFVPVTVALNCIVLFVCMDAVAGLIVTPVTVGVAGAGVAGVAGAGVAGLAGEGAGVEGEGAGVAGVAGAGVAGLAGEGAGAEGEGAGVAGVAGAGAGVAGAEGEGAGVEGGLDDCTGTTFTVTLPDLDVSAFETANI